MLFIFKIMCRVRSYTEANKYTYLNHKNQNLTKTASKNVVYHLAIVSLSSRNEQALKRQAANYANIC